VAISIDICNCIWYYLRENEIWEFKMTKKEKLLAKAAKSPQNLRFEEFITLLEQNGFTISRIKGSHFVACHEKTQQAISIQERRGNAKLYQVKQFFEILKEENL
jgi:predicted RNA binding protein YcfA (HicA-like mRNA interferase family)